MQYILKRKLEIVSFVSGAVLMTVELVGSRLISPYLGVSTFIWTSIIGVILAFLSLGYWYGGKLSLKNPNEKTLSRILFLAFLSIASILFLQPFLILFSTLSIDLRILAIFASILLFGPMSFLLGLVSPYVVRLKILSTDTSGSTVGTLYAISTLGSILGTFLGGFFLISIMGISTIIFYASLTLFLMFILAGLNSDFSKEKFIAGLVILTSLLFLPKSVVGSIGDIDTAYNRWIVEDFVNEQSEAVRYLKNNVIGTQSGIYKSDPTKLLFPYLQVFDLAPDLKKNSKETLLVGAGAYTYPMHFSAKYPKSGMDIVEIDGGLEKIATQFFGFEKEEKFSIYNMDGRIFFQNNDKKYDLIWVDAFSSELSIPYHLTTLEAVTDLKKSLKGDGVVIVNIISSIDGKNSKFISAIRNTYLKVFPNIFVLSVSGKSPDDIQNLILVASNDSQIFNQKSISKSVAKPWVIVDPKNFDQSIPVLTDQFAPVESYISGFLTGLK